MEQETRTWMEGTLLHLIPITILSNSILQRRQKYVKDTTIVGNLSCEI